MLLQLQNVGFNNKTSQEVVKYVFKSQLGQQEDISKEGNHTLL